MQSVPRPSQFLHRLTASAIVVVGLMLSGGEASAQSGDETVAISNPYADAPVIPAPDEMEFNSFASMASAAPVLQLPDMPGGPVVVELFTSQGCSSCPPADAMLSKLADDPDVLALSYHVDYWDYLGWADEFARPEFTARQKGYALSVGERAVYTPQLIVAGQDTAPSIRPADLMAMIDAQRASPAMVNISDVTEGDQRVIELTPLSDLGGRAAVILVRYAPNRSAEILGGENRGRMLSYRNVVLDTTLLSIWDGQAELRLTIGREVESNDDFLPDTRHAILIQRLFGGKSQLPGPILTALPLD